jgi:centrosomal protein CEP104
MRSVNLAYTILSCSSEDPSYPIASIQSSTIRSNGWQSAPNTRFPVEFVVDLGSKCDLETLQFVSHQSKIPQRVDLFFGESPMKFRTLGSFQFSDNSQTRYSARELKSANLQRVSARYLRVSIASCHRNVNNPGNQVGLVSFKVIGRGEQAKPAAEARQPKLSHAQLDANFDSRVARLEQQKREAVAAEEFTLAGQLKKEIDTLKGQRDRLLQLQRAKQEAIAVEDFVAANDYKVQIERLLGGETERAQSPPSPPPEPKPKVKPRPPLPPVGDDPEPPPPRPPPKQKAASRRAIPADLEPPAPSGNGADLSEERAIRPRIPSSSDEEDNPILKINDLAGSITAHPDEDVPESDEVPDELKPSDRQEATPLINLFGEDDVRRFFSKSWTLRLQGIKRLTQRISDLASDYSAAFQTFCFVARHRIQENQKQVVIAALNGVREIAETHQIEPPELTRGIAHFLATATAKIGGSQQNVSDAVCDFLIWLSQRKALDVVLPIVMTPSNNAAQWKAALARINTLHDIVLLHGINTEPGLGVLEVMTFVTPSLESAKVEVRTAVCELIVSLERMVGNGIMRFLEKLPTRTKREVQKAIEQHRDE